MDLTLRKTPGVASVAPIRKRGKFKYILLIALIIVIGFLIFFVLFNPFSSLNEESTTQVGGETGKSVGEVCSSLELSPVGCLVDSGDVKVVVTQEIKGDLEGVEFIFFDKETGKEIKVRDEDARSRSLFYNFFLSLIDLIVRPFISLLNLFGAHIAYSPAG